MAEFASTLQTGVGRHLGGNLPGSLNRQLEYMEEKVATGGTKRRRHVQGSYISPLSKRITRLAKQLKQSNPTHVYASTLGSAFTSISTTGAIYEVCANIIQGACALF